MRFDACHPLLERDERGEVQKQTPEAAEQTDMVSALAANAGAEERLRTLDTELENVYTHESRADAASREAMAPPPESGWASLRPQGALSLDAEGLDFDATLTRKPTLAEHLTDQMHLALTAAADQLIGLIDDAVVIADRDHNIVRFNRAAEEVFGWKESEVLGRPLDLLIPERFHLQHGMQIDEFAHGPLPARLVA